MNPRVVAITSSAYDEETIVRAANAAAAALPAGDFAVQLREKEDGRRRRRLARSLRERTRALIVINGDFLLAEELAADGIHVPQANLHLGRTWFSKAWVSTSAHNDDDVRRASAFGVSAVLVSPIFDSPGKGPPRGTAALTAARAIAPGLGVYALGGVSAANAVACHAAGASGVAVIRALFEAEDPAAVAWALVTG